jgi:hypothetical protein
MDNFNLKQYLAENKLNENIKDMSNSKNDLYNKMLEMLQEIVEQIEDGRTYVTVDDIKNLIKEAAKTEE